MSTAIGIMPYDTASKYGAPISRKVVYVKSWWGWFASAYKDRILLNVNYSSDQGEFASDLAGFKSKLVSINSKLKPELIAIQNEEDLHLNDFDRYLSELMIAASACRVVNGGITQQSLGYFYYSMTQDEQFFFNNINQKQAYKNGDFAYNIECVKKELEFIKDNPNIPYVNCHYYVGYVTQAAGLIRMFNYITRNYKQVMCNEAGVYRTGLLQTIVDIARQCAMPYLILFSGTGTDGSGKALPISKADFDTVSL